MRKLILQIFAGILALYLAIRFVPGAEFYGQRWCFLLAGTLLGLFNYLIKPILGLILFPLRFLTLGLITLVIDLGIVWFTLVIMFGEYFTFNSLFSFLIVTLIIYVVYAITNLAEMPIIRRRS